MTPASMSKAHPSDVYTQLVLRHESTRSKVEQELIKRRLRQERHVAIMQSVRAAEEGDVSGRSVYYRHFKRASKALFAITGKDIYRDR